LNQEIYIAYIFGLWSLTTLSTIFQLYRGDQFYWWRKPDWSRYTNATLQIKLKRRQSYKMTRYGKQVFLQKTWREIFLFKNG